MYKKQEWKDEIPDLSKPILDSTGKQKVDPQTGRPLWELVQEGTRITSSRLNHMEDGIQAAHDSIENISQSLTPESIGAAKKADLDTFQKNSVSIKTNTSKDFNTYREPGLFFVGSLSEYTNAPSSDGGFSWGILRVETLGTTAYVVQSYTCVLNNVTFTRSKAEDSTGRGWEPWRATSKLDSDGVLRLSKWLDIRSDGPAANLIGSTHVYQQFLVGDQRKGYVGAGDPNAPNNIAVVSDHGDTVVNAKTNIWLNASAGAVHLNGRNVLWELDQVKQSGVNNKQALVDALNAKGIAASVNEDWGTLIAKVRQAAVIKTAYINTEREVAPNKYSDRHNFFDMPPGTTKVTFFADSDYSTAMYEQSNYYDGTQMEFVVRDGYGHECVVAGSFRGSRMYLFSFSIDTVANNARCSFYDGDANKLHGTYNNKAADLNPDKGLSFGTYIFGTGHTVVSRAGGLITYS
ncbi:pyocin knob domain-containing protein [Paenibacillus sp. chi10]|uniref:Pyocin knob domain-containing protein n=1 Tax=Paenibacillus suaedae TaxID=3077233 RepID=A0AAJ2K029_9BACL|nr:pyocin knob domain-containing protein [Paenibacillus sp. chi10]MDT8979968.1 pyocin knob domain-containing protein [Paenibacillus sp. chi10]